MGKYIKIIIKSKSQFYHMQNLSNDYKNCKKMRNNLGIIFFFLFIIFIKTSLHDTGLVKPHYMIQG